MRLRHARVEVELHELSQRDGPALLLLHALGGSSADWSEMPALWPGRVLALDFSGHGASAWVHGSVYAPELLMGDADTALAHTGPAAIIGAGLGAYVALLLAGARADQVTAALLLPGRGLDGGGAEPDFDRHPLRTVRLENLESLPPGCDPFCAAMQMDIRPPEYVARVITPARRLLLLEDGLPRPPWWETARALPAAESISGDMAGAVARLRAAVA